MWLFRANTGSDVGFLITSFSSACTFPSQSATARIGNTEPGQTTPRFANSSDLTAKTRGAALTKSLFLPYRLLSARDRTCGRSGALRRAASRQGLGASPGPVTRWVRHVAASTCTSLSRGEGTAPRQGGTTPRARGDGRASMEVQRDRRHGPQPHRSPQRHRSPRSRRRAGPRGAASPPPAASREASAAARPTSPRSRRGQHGGAAAAQEADPGSRASSPPSRPAPPALCPLCRTAVPSSRRADRVPPGGLGASPVPRPPRASRGAGGSAPPLRLRGPAVPAGGSAQRCR